MSKSSKKKSSPSKKKELKKISIRKEELAFPAAIFVLVIGVLYLLPAWEEADYFVKIDSATISSDEVETTISYSAPWAGSCYLTTDVRPEGAPKGEPETEEWSENHLIRQHFENGVWWVEKWVNVEVLPDRANTKTYRYQIEPQEGPLELFVELKCDDELLDSTSQLIVRQ